MATSKSIRASLDALNDSLIEADCFARTIADLGFALGTETPPWIHAVTSQFDRIKQAAEALEVILNTQAIPQLSMHEGGQS